MFRISAGKLKNEIPDGFPGSFRVLDLGSFFFGIYTQNQPAIPGLEAVSVTTTESIAEIPKVLSQDNPLDNQNGILVL